MKCTLLALALQDAGLRSPAYAHRRLCSSVFAVFGALRSYEPPRRFRHILEGRQEP